MWKLQPVNHVLDNSQNCGCAWPESWPGTHPQHGQCRHAVCRVHGPSSTLYAPINSSAQPPPIGERAHSKRRTQGLLLIKSSPWVFRWVSIGGADGSGMESASARCTPGAAIPLPPPLRAPPSRPLQCGYQQQRNGPLSVCVSNTRLTFCYLAKIRLRTAGWDSGPLAVRADIRAPRQWAAENASQNM